MAYWTAGDGSRLYYETHGLDGRQPPLLLLPGLLGSCQGQWERFRPALQPSFPLVLMDLRGHGQSHNNQVRLEPERMAQDITGLMDALNVERFHLAGYDLGGYLGLLLALKWPRRVLTLLIHATKFYWNEESASRMQRQLRPEEMAAQAPTYATQLAQEHGGSRWRALVRQASDLVAWLWQQGLAEAETTQIPCPTLVSVGDRDELVSLPEAHRLSRLLPQGALLTLPAVRHPFASIRPVPFLPAMQAFHRTGGWAAGEW